MLADMKKKEQRAKNKLGSKFRQWHRYGSNNARLSGILYNMLQRTWDFLGFDFFW
jgi:hypothetical protein